MPPMKRFRFILIFSVTLCGACKEEKSPCEGCNPFPQDASVFVGKWQWEYTVMTSEYDVGTVFKHRDIITPNSAGNDVSF